MKKKELLEMKKLSATPKILELVQQDNETIKTVHYTYSGHENYHIYQRYQYYRAVVQNGVLKVAVFSRKRLACGDMDPEYEIYLSKEKNTHLTYVPASGKWRKGKIDRLNYDLDNGYCYGNKPWASEENKKLVNDYLGTGTMEVKTAILTFQNKVGADKLKKKHKSELEEIDAVMNEVPELPKDFDKWVLDSAFIHEHYLLYESGSKENTAYCTHCKKWVKLKEAPRHNKNGTCPSCKSIALLKSWRKQKYLTGEKNVGIIQKLMDGSGYILRRFLCKTKRTRENGWKLEEERRWETQRFKLDGHFRKQDSFKWGEYKNTGVIRWCYEIKSGWGGHYYSGNEQCILYTRNLKRLRKNTEMQYIPIEELWRRNPGSYCSVIDGLRWLINHQKVEYLIKAKLYRLAWDLMKNGGYRQTGTVDWEQTKPWKALRIQKEQIAMCIKMDITERQLDVLQRANAAEIKLTEEQICFFTREIGPDLVGEIFQYGHPAKFRKYMGELLAEKENKIGDYMDYLEDIKKLRIRPDLDVLFPRNFQQIHQRLALQRQEQEDAIKKMEIEQKDRLLQAMLPELQEVYSMEDENFIIILPTCKEDFNREGRENHNCVGGSYFDKMLEETGQTKIVLQVDMVSEKILQEYINCNEAAQVLFDEGTKKDRLISRCARGKCRSAYGYFWRYKEGE